MRRGRVAARGRVFRWIERQRAKKGGGAGRSRRRRNSGLVAAASWFLTAMVWASIAGALVVAFYAAKLPPIDLLTVPKRPPNIAILADDGTLLANRGDTGGAAIRTWRSAALSAEGLRRHRGSPLLFALGHRPLGHSAGADRNAAARRHAGRLDADAATRQEPVPDAGADPVAQDQEAILAVWLEHKFTKNQILELYLNRVYFGSGAYGVEAAAQKYFGHGARNVTLAEAAILAGLMKAPTKLAPNRNPPGRGRARAGDQCNGRGRLHHGGDGKNRPRQSGASRARRRGFGQLRGRLCDGRTRRCRSAPSTRISSWRRRSAPPCSSMRNRR